MTGESLDHQLELTPIGTYQVGSCMTSRRKTHPASFVPLNCSANQHPLPDLPLKPFALPHRTSKVDSNTMAPRWKRSASSIVSSRLRALGAT